MRSRRLDRPRDGQGQHDTLGDGSPGVQSPSATGRERHQSRLVLGLFRLGERFPALACGMTRRGRGLGMEQPQGQGKGRAELYSSG